MVKNLFEEGERWVLQPKPANLWWSSAYAKDVREDITFEATKGQDIVFFLTEVSSFWYAFRQPNWHIAWKLVGTKNAESPQDRYRDVRIHRSNDMQTRGGSSPQRVHLCVRRLVVE